MSAQPRNINTKIIEGKLSKMFISEVCIKPVALRITWYTRSSSQFQKGWWPLFYWDRFCGIVKKRALNQNKNTNMIACSNAGNCPYSQNFGVPRNRVLWALSLFSLMVNPRLLRRFSSAAPQVYCESVRSRSSSQNLICKKATWTHMPVTFKRKTYIFTLFIFRWSTWRTAKWPIVSLVAAWLATSHFVWPAKRYENQ